MFVSFSKLEVSTLDGYYILGFLLFLFGIFFLGKAFILTFTGEPVGKSLLVEGAGISVHRALYGKDAENLYFATLEESGQDIILEEEMQILRSDRLYYLSSENKWKETPEEGSPAFVKKSKKFLSALRVIKNQDARIVFHEHGGKPFYKKVSEVIKKIESGEHPGEEYVKSWDKSKQKIVFK